MFAYSSGAEEQRANAARQQNAALPGAQGAQPPSNLPFSDYDSFRRWENSLSTSTPLASNYQVPDYVRDMGLMGTGGDDSSAARYLYFRNNPGIAEDWARVRSGQTSQFATDGSTIGQQRGLPYDTATGEIVDVDGSRWDPITNRQVAGPGGSRDGFEQSARSSAQAAGATPSSTAAATGTSSALSGAAPQTGAASEAGLSTNQQALLKALLDQQEIDGITGETRDNASELYDRTQNYEQDALGDIATYTGGNAGIYNRYQGDIENDVGTAVSDARAGQTVAANTAARQAMRYGVSVPGALSGVSTAQASQLAGAANGTRNSAIDKYRALVGQGIGLKQDAFKTSQAGVSDAMNRAESSSMTGRNLRLQDEASDWAKQLDVTGMARGLPGASAGAYSASINAGNSAVANKMAPGQALLNGQNQSNATTMQGQQLALQGTSNILNAQTSYANSQAQSGSGVGGLGSLLGGTASLVTAFSDRRLKENIEAVGSDPATGLTLYHFEYIGGSGKRFEGVMADEVEAVMPDAVVEMPDGFKAVNYQMLGIEMKEVA